MSKRMRLLVAAGVLFGVCGLAAAADDLAAVQKKIQANWEKQKSMTAKLTMITKSERGESTMEGKGEGAIEVLRKGNKVLVRMETKTKTSHKMGEEEMKMEQEMLAIVDGEYVYTIADSMGQKIAFKSKIDPKITGEPKALFESLAKDGELKLLPEETIEGKKVHVIQAPVKTMEGGPVTTTVWYFDQETGFIVKMAVNQDGKPIQTLTYSDIKINVDIDPDRFVFKAPEGVQVIDQTTRPDRPARPEQGEKPEKPEEPTKP